MTEVQHYDDALVDVEAGAVVANEGWRRDESGLPVFSADSAEVIDSELAGLRSVEGEYKLRIAAVLTEASDKRFYGEGSLERTCKENQINYGTGQKMVTGYKRLRNLGIPERSGIVAALLSGELYWSKAEIAAPVEDDEKYASLLNESANGGLSAANLRKRVKDERGAKNDQEVADVEEEPEDPNAIRKIIKAGAMEYVVEFNDGKRHTVVRSVLLEKGFKKCSCCDGYGVVERHQDQSKEN